MKIIHILILISCILCTVRGERADLVIFSYDRPLQLYALLESVERHMTGVGEMIVIYRASDARFKSAYGIVSNCFSGVQFLEQGVRPREDFKPLTLSAVFDSPSSYVIFAVDDNVVKDKVDLSWCIELLEKTKAYGFHLRLGEHLNYCYPRKSPQRVPKLTRIADGVCTWVFASGEHGWAYPHSVDMTVFSKKEIEAAFHDIDYTSPNTLEGRWSLRSGDIMQRCGLCFRKSKIINLPLNKVQHDNGNPSMEISPLELLDQFERGFKMDIDPLYQIVNRSVHMEYQPTFVMRN